MIYSFGSNGRGPGDGYNPQSSLTEDGHGNLYGTTYYGGAYAGGTVYELSPPAHPGSAWTETVLYSFQQPYGLCPTSGVVSDGSGNLYGTTSGGGPTGLGVVYELSPPAIAGGPWVESVIYNFAYNGSDTTGEGGGGVVFVKGNLYVVTQYGGNGNGSVLELRPPSTSSDSWLVREIFAFSGDVGGTLPLALGGALIADSSGDLYGTALGGVTGSSGLVFELSPPSTQGGVWAETVLYDFDVSLFAPLVFDKSGNLYGTAAPYVGQGISMVFELSPPSPPGGPWTENTLFTFTASNEQAGYNPYGGLVLDKAGNLYGTTTAGGKSSNCGTQGCGTVFELSPSGSLPWTERILHSFSGHLTDGVAPAANLTMDSAGRLFGITLSGGAYLYGGSAFEVVP
jgi:uncharacterized repeat protein (TIGR03803 family)